MSCSANELSIEMNNTNINLITNLFLNRGDIENTLENMTWLLTLLRSCLLGNIYIYQPQHEEDLQVKVNTNDRHYKAMYNWETLAPGIHVDATGSSQPPITTMHTATLQKLTRIAQGTLQGAKGVNLASSLPETQSIRGMCQNKSDP